MLMTETPAAALKRRPVQCSKSSGRIMLVFVTASCETENLCATVKKSSFTLNVFT